jgi:hypothetical protein
LSWDIHTKLLLKECPQDFVAYFAPGAHYVGMRETQFQTRVDSAYEQREIRADLMIEAEENGVYFLISPEIQSTKGEKMDERLLGYSYEATRLSGLNVMSGVFYLCRVSDAPQPPLKRVVPNDFQSIWFNYLSFEIGEKLVEEIRQINLDGFWPWMVLCRDGAYREVVEEVLTYLHRRKRANLILLTKFYADMVFESEADKLWLQRRFEVLQEFLFENSQVYRDIEQKGRKEGREEGREEGIEEGSVKEARRLIEVVAQARFPDLFPALKNQVEQLNDLKKLREISLLISTAHTAEEVEQSLPDARAM